MEGNMSGKWKEKKKQKKTIKTKQNMRKNGKQRNKNNAKIGWRTLFRGGFIYNFRKIGVRYFGEYINTTRTLYLGWVWMGFARISKVRGLAVGTPGINSAPLSARETLHSAARALSGTL